MDFLKSLYRSTIYVTKYKLRKGISCLRLSVKLVTCHLDIFFLFQTWKFLELQLSVVAQVWESKPIFTLIYHYLQVSEPSPLSLSTSFSFLSCT